MSYRTHNQKGPDKGLLDPSHHSRLQPAQSPDRSPTPPQAEGSRLGRVTALTRPVGPSSPS